MSRQATSRNQRSKGIKVKHVMQISLLIAICFWLIYQVKHSHDKKKEYDESDATASISRGGSDVFIRLGRKVIHPQDEDTITKNEKRDEETEEEETTGVVDENKREEDELEDKKVEDTEIEKVGGGGDKIEDHGQEKLDAEIDREEDFIDGEKERDEEDDNENENEEKDSDDDGQMEKENSTGRADHDGDDSFTHEAHEEHYKADDASSAVTQDTRVEASENENQNYVNVNGHHENILEEIDTGEKRKDLEEGGEMAIDEKKQSNVTNDEVKENVEDVSENDSSLNTAVTEVSDDDHLKTSSSSTEISTETQHQEILSEEGTDETKDAESNTLESSEISNNQNSSTETNDSIAADDDANEILESENIENLEEIQQDSIDVSDSSHSLEEIDTRVDLDTLPEIQTEGTNTEDAASK